VRQLKTCNAENFQICFIKLLQQTIFMYFNLLNSIWTSTALHVFLYVRHTKNQNYFLNNMQNIHFYISGTTSRRGSRPFLSPEVGTEPTDGSCSSNGGRSTRSGRRDSLSPDSASTEDGQF
jgi:hypothetical protein